MVYSKSFEVKSTPSLHFGHPPASISCKEKKQVCIMFFPPNSICLNMVSTLSLCSLHTPQRVAGAENLSPVIALNDSSFIYTIHCVRV